MYLNNVQQTLENLVYTGNSTLSKASCQKLGSLINDCSSNGFFRLAAILRSINSQLIMILEKKGDIDIERYAFLINQAWLLTKGLLIAIDNNNTELIEKYSSQSRKITLKEIIVIPLGLEKIVKGLERVNYRFHFLVLKCTELPELEKSIITWTKIYDTQKHQKNYPNNFNYEYLLAKKLKFLDVPLFEFLNFQKIRFIDWEFNIKQNSVRSNKESKVNFTDIENKNLAYLPFFNIRKFKQDLQKQLETISPIDHEYTFYQNIGFRDIILTKRKKRKNTKTETQIKKNKKEAKITKENHDKNLFYCSFTYARLNFVIEIKRTVENKTIIAKLERLINNYRTIPYIYGILRIKKGEFSLVPISFLESLNEEITAKKEHKENKKSTKTKNAEYSSKEASITQKNRLFLIQIEKKEIKPLSDKKILLTDQRKNLDLLGDLLAKKKKI